MLVCRLFVGLVLVVVVSNHHRAELPSAIELQSAPAGLVLASEGNSGRAPARNDPEAHELEPVAREHFEKGRYRNALDAYTRWVPMGFCADSFFAMHDERACKIAYCYVHMGKHAAAARVCLEAAEADSLGCDDTALFTIQLYREAGQLNDLVALLNAIEHQLLAERLAQKRSLEPGRRASVLALTGAGAVRRHLEAEQLARVKPWPDRVPKPKPGSLPK